MVGLGHIRWWPTYIYVDRLGTLAYYIFCIISYSVSFFCIYIYVLYCVLPFRGYSNSIIYFLQIKSKSKCYSFAERPTIIIPYSFWWFSINIFSAFFFLVLFRLSTKLRFLFLFFFFFFILTFCGFLFSEAIGSLIKNSIFININWGNIQKVRWYELLNEWPLYLFFLYFRLHRNNRWGEEGGW